MSCYKLLLSLCRSWKGQLELRNGDGSPRHRTTGENAGVRRLGRDGESRRSNPEGFILGSWEEVGKRVIGEEQIMMGQSSLSSWVQRESEESIELVMRRPLVTFKRAVARRSLDLRSQIS